MFPQLFDILICPLCKSHQLKLQKAEFQENEVWSGNILCENCSNIYPIKTGIPCLLSSELLAAQDNPDTEQWIRKKKDIENSILDENLETFKVVYKEAAQKDGLNEKIDRFVWEKILHQDNQSLRDKLGTNKASKWVITKNNLYNRNERIFAKITELKDAFAGSQVLNVGVGIDDDLIDRLTFAGTKVVNCDIVIDTLIEVKSRNKVECVSSDIKSLPFDKQSFEAVFCFLVLHHIDLLHEALSEIMRVLKPGGSVFILEINPYTPIKLPGRIFPTLLKKVIRKVMRKCMAGSDQRIFKSSPYEKIYSSKLIISSMINAGFYNVTRKVASHYPSFIIFPFSKIWDFLSFNLPFLFDPIAFEYLFYGKKTS